MIDTTWSVGTDGRQLRLQLNGARRQRPPEVIVARCQRNTGQINATLDELDALSDGDLLDFTALAKVFGLSDDRDAGFDAEPAWLPRDGGIPVQFAHAVLLVRAFGAFAGSAGGQHRRSAISGHRRHVGPSCARGVVTAGGIDASAINNYPPCGRRRRLRWTRANFITGGRRRRLIQDERNRRRAQIAQL